MSTKLLDEKQQSRIKYFLDIFDKGAEAYKTGQILFEKIDGKIHNEFVYSSRAKSTILRCIIEGKFNNDFDLSINNATESACHILNDSLDLVFLYAKQESERLSKICDFSGIRDVYDKYAEVGTIINKIALQISQSRKTRGSQRVEKYIQLTESDDYQILINFCYAIPKIEEDLKKKRKEEVDVSRKWGLTIITRIIGGIIVSFVAWKYFSN
jgi:hypothetical protein